MITQIIMMKTRSASFYSTSKPRVFQAFIMVIISSWESAVQTMSDVRHIRKMINRKEYSVLFQDKKRPYVTDIVSNMWLFANGFWGGAKIAFFNELPRTEVRGIQ